MKKSFNPLNRGNLNQIEEWEAYKKQFGIKFQSPKSGKFESNTSWKKSRPS